MQCSGMSSYHVICSSSFSKERVHINGKERKGPSHHRLLLQVKNNFY